MIPQTKMKMGWKVVVGSKIVIPIVDELTLLCIQPNTISTIRTTIGTIADSLLATSLVVNETIWLAKAETWAERLIIRSTS